MDISLHRDITVIIGPPDSGKSNLAKYLLSLDPYKRHLVYDPLFGFDPDDYNVIRPPTNDYKWRRYELGNPELNKAVDKFVWDTKPKFRPEYLVVDEAARLLPLSQDEGPAMGNVSDFNAHIDLGNGHMGMGLWLLCQRFAQLNTDLENKATHYFIMGFGGKNDRQAIKKIHPDIIDYIQDLEEYEFVYVGPNGVIRKFGPVDKMGEKAKI